MKQSKTLLDAIETALSFKEWGQMSRAEFIESHVRSYLKRVRKLTPADDALGSWMSAALEDPKVCDEMKRDIKTWMDSFQYPESA